MKAWTRAKKGCIKTGATRENIVDLYNKQRAADRLSVPTPEKQRAADRLPVLGGGVCVGYRFCHVVANRRAGFEMTSRAVPSDRSPVGWRRISVALDKPLNPCELIAQQFVARSEI